jgi:hypothetical protein
MSHTIYQYIPYQNEDEALMDEMLTDLVRTYSPKAIAKGTGIKEKRFKQGLTFNNEEFRSVLAFYLKEKATTRHFPTFSNF